MADSEKASNGGDVPDILGFNMSRANGRERVVASMPVDADAFFYNMNHPKRGICLIFNHETFDVPKLNDRAGTNADLKGLRETFTSIGFEVRHYQDLRVDQLLGIIDDVSKSNHSDHDCLAVCVLSHGEEGIIFARDTCYKHEMLWGPFTADNCPTLAGKPKMFFVQACQGTRLDPGMTLMPQVDSPSSGSYKIPVQADFLVAFSTMPGYYSWRNTGRGSWFVQALVAELKESAFVYDLMTLLVFVNRRVAISFESNTPDNPVMHNQKQIPCIYCRLTRLVKFMPKRIPSSE